jgi:ATP-dependent protease ClpP protease subunit
MKKFGILVIALVFSVTTFGCLTSSSNTISGYGVSDTLEPVKYLPRSVNFGNIEFLSDTVATVTIEEKIHPRMMKSLWLASERLKITKIKELKILMMSPGGYAFCAIPLAGLVEKIQKQGIKVTTYAVGMVASAAVPMFAIANERVAAPGTLFMVHHITSGSQDKDREFYEKITKTYINILAKHSYLSKAKIRKMMDESAQFTAEEALKLGLVDRIE